MRRIKKNFMHPDWHWDDPEGWDGEGYGRGAQDGEHMQIHGWSMSMHVKPIFNTASTVNPCVVVILTHIHLTRPKLSASRPTTPICSSFTISHLNYSFCVVKRFSFFLFRQILLSCLLVSSFNVCQDIVDEKLNNN